MTSIGSTMTSTEATAETAPTVRIAAFGTVIKRLGNWTGERRFEVRAHRGTVVLDLRSPQIPEGEITVTVELDHCLLKLLLPDDAPIDDWDLHRTGHCQVKDGQPPHESGARRIVLSGRMAGAEIRVHRSGVAVLSAICSREFLADLRASHKAGVQPSVADPAHTA